MTDPIAPKDKDTGSKFDEYQPLSGCVLVDSRFSSRREIVGNLKSGNLFENIHEAGSIEEGVQMLSTMTVDACVVGPSVKRQSAMTFFDRVEETMMSKDCALIVVRSTEQGTVETNDFPHAHGVISMPCLKRQFNDGVINAVITANQKSPWAKLGRPAAEIHVVHANQSRAEDLPQHMQANRGGTADPATPSASDPAAGVVGKSARPTVDASAGQLGKFMAVGQEFTKSLERLESGVFGFKPDGTPAATTAKVVAEIVNQLTRTQSPVVCSSEDGAAFKQVLESCLYQWLKDLKTFSRPQATFRLRETLVRYVLGNNGSGSSAGDEQTAATQSAEGGSDA